MRKILLLTCFTLLLTASVTQAAELDFGGLVSLKLPADWVVVDKVTTNADGLMSVIVGKNDRSVIVTLFAGDSEGHSAKEVAEALGDSVGAVEAPVSYEDQWGFATEAQGGVKGFCVAASGKSKFLLTCISGTLEKASGVIESITSSKYPELVPK